LQRPPAQDRLQRPGVDGQRPGWRSSDDAAGGRLVHRRDPAQPGGLAHAAAGVHRRPAPGMKVGLVCPYSLDVPGGVQNHVRDLAEVLRARGHEVGVLAPGERPETLPAYVTLVGKAVAVPYNGSVARLAFGPRVSARTTRWLREGQFDLVHIHEPLAPSVSVLALWACEA